MGSLSVANGPDYVQGSAADSASPASNADAVVTYSGVRGQFHVLAQMYASFDTDPSPASTLTVEDVSGNVVWAQDIATKGNYSFTLSPAIQSGAMNTQMIITLSAGGSGVTGKLSCRHYLVQS